MAKKQIKKTVAKKTNKKTKVSRSKKAPDYRLVYCDDGDGGVIDFPQGVTGLIDYNIYSDRYQ